MWYIFRVLFSGSETLKSYTVNEVFASNKNITFQVYKLRMKMAMIST